MSRGREGLDIWGKKLKKGEEGIGVGGGCFCLSPLIKNDIAKGF